MSEPGLRIYQVTFKAKLIIRGTPADWRIDLFQLVGEEQGLDEAVAQARIRLPSAVRWKLCKALWVAKTVPAEELEGEFSEGEDHVDEV